MAARKKKKPKPEPLPATPPRIHEAMLDSGPSGFVIKGAEIDLTVAIARRRAGQDVVVCGANLRANRNLARTIEAGAGTPTRPQEPHNNAGPHALPHFHQEARSAGGHTFYETDNPRRKARQRR
jgi:hypothetical protein